MQKIKKIAIIGLGPVGMVLAVHLKNAGHNIALFVRSEEKKEVIEDNGITLTGFIENKADFKFVYDDISEVGNFNPEVIISAVKSNCSVIRDGKTLYFRRYFNALRSEWY